MAFVPWPDEIVPVVMLQAYVAPAVAGTEAVRRVALGQAFGGAVIVGGGGVQAAVTVSDVLPLLFAGVESFDALTFALKVTVPAAVAVTFTPTGAVLEAASDGAVQLIKLVAFVQEAHGADQVMLLIVPPVTLTLYEMETAGSGPAFAAPSVALNGVPVVAAAGTLAKETETSADVVEMFAANPLASPLLPFPPLPTVNSMLSPAASATVTFHRCCTL